MGLEDDNTPLPSMAEPRKLPSSPSPASTSSPRMTGGHQRSRSIINLSAGERREVAKAGGGSSSSSQAGTSGKAEVGVSGSGGAGSSLQDSTVADPDNRAEGIRIQRVSPQSSSPSSSTTDIHISGRSATPPLRGRGIPWKNSSPLHLDHTGSPNSPQGASPGSPPPSAAIAMIQQRLRRSSSPGYVLDDSGSNFSLSPPSPRLQAAFGSAHARRASGGSGVRRPSSPLLRVPSSPGATALPPPAEPFNAADSKHAWDSVWPSRTSSPGPSSPPPEIAPKSPSPAAASVIPVSNQAGSPIPPKLQSEFIEGGPGYVVMPSPWRSASPGVGEASSFHPRTARRSFGSAGTRGLSPPFRSTSPNIAMQRSRSADVSAPSIDVSPPSGEPIQPARRNSDADNIGNSRPRPATGSESLASAEPRKTARSPLVRPSPTLDWAYPSSSPVSSRSPWSHSGDRNLPALAVAPPLAADTLSPESPHAPNLALPTEESASADEPAAGAPAHGRSLLIGPPGSPVTAVGGVLTARPRFGSTPPQPESPPKQRSFIEMPPRSGYELSDDPDDVGSEEDGSSIGSGSGRESIGADDDDDDDDEQGSDAGSERDEFGVGDMDEDDERRDDQPIMRRRASSDGLEDLRWGDVHNFRREREGFVPPASTPAGESSSDGSSSSARPGLPKRPSLTRSAVVPPNTTSQADIEAHQRKLDLALHKTATTDDSDVKERLAELRVVSGAGSHQDGDSEMSEAYQEESSSEDQEAMQLQQQTEFDNLSTLERIFLFAKSKMAYHRALVSRSLAEWIVDVELSDAVEYVIPLLNGLGTDEVDVCAAFAPELHRIMWFFFRNCPLAELEPATPDNRTEAAAGDSADDKAGSVAETAMRPRLPVGTFTPLLCALLLNQSTMIAGSAQASIVQFFDLLHSGPTGLEPAYGAEAGQDPADISLDDLDADVIKPAAGHDGRAVPYEAYVFDQKARALIENELLEHVAFAVARLHTGGHEISDASIVAVASSDVKGHSTSDERPSAAVGANSGNQNYPSAEDEDNADVPGSNIQLEVNDIDTSSVDNDKSWEDLQPETDLLNSYSQGAALSFDQMSSSASGNGHNDVEEEAAVGRMACVSLLAAICAEGILPVEKVTNKIAPEILRMSSDTAFYVRKEVAIALGSMAKMVEEQLARADLVTTLQTLLEDNIWHVRQAACLSMTAVLARLPTTVFRDRIVNSLRALNNDVSRNVRGAAFEIIGEAIHLFAGDPDGVPEELVRFFVGEPFEGREKASSDSPAEYSLLTDFGFRSIGEHPVGGSPWDDEFTMLHRHDPDRPIVTAYNMPAVVLTLGPENWHRLQPLHAKLFADPSPKVQRSLASSLHELAKILGPELATRDLLPQFHGFLEHFDLEIKAAALEYADDFLFALPREIAEAELRRFKDLWTGSFASEWRLRERLAHHIPGMAARFVLEDEDGSLVAIMQLALQDPISIVREAGVRSVPALYTLFAEHDQVIADGFLGMISDLGSAEGYRLRTACLLSIQALVENRIQRSSFEVLLLQRLIELAADPVVDVRIALARVVALMCRLDELYALPQSRSPELLGLLQKLSHDRSAEVFQYVVDLLPADEQDGLGLVGAHNGRRMHSPSPPRRHLILGPSDGGPHRPEPGSTGASSSGHVAADQSFDYSDDVDMHLESSSSSDDGPADPDQSIMLDSDMDGPASSEIAPQQNGRPGINGVEVVNDEQGGASGLQFTPNPARSPPTGKALGLLSLSSPDRHDVPGSHQPLQPTTIKDGNATGDPFLVFLANQHSQSGDDDGSGSAGNAEQKPVALFHPEVSEGA